MPNPNVNNQVASQVRNVLGHVEDLYNQELVTRAFEDASIEASKIVGGAGISRYSNSVVVDSNGNGDYTTIPAAIAAEPSGTLIHVMNGLYSIPSTQVLTKSIGLSLSLFTQVLGGVALSPMFDIQTNGELSVIGQHASLVSGQFGIPFALSGDAILRLHNVWCGAGGAASVVDINDVNATVDIRYSRLESATNAIDTVGALVTNSFIGWNIVSGSSNAINSAVAWNNAPIYYNTLQNGTTNVTPNAGAANGNNVDI